MAERTLIGLLRHEGHNLTIVTYGPKNPHTGTVETIKSVTLECDTCGCVVLEFMDSVDGTLHLGMLVDEEEKKLQEKYLAAAKKHYDEGELEIDDNAVVSLGDDPGAYVQCWKWISAEEAGVKTEEDRDD